MNNDMTFIEQQKNESIIENNSNMIQNKNNQSLDEEQSKNQYESVHNPEENLIKSEKHSLNNKSEIQEKLNHYEMHDSSINASKLDKIQKDDDDNKLQISQIQNQEIENKFETEEQKFSQNFDQNLNHDNKYQNGIIQEQQQNEFDIHDQQYIAQKQEEDKQEIVQKNGKQVQKTNKKTKINQNSQKELQENLAESIVQESGEHHLSISNEFTGSEKKTVESDKILSAKKKKLELENKLKQLEGEISKIQSSIQKKPEKSEKLDSLKQRNLIQQDISQQKNAQELTHKMVLLRKEKEKKRQEEERALQLKLEESIEKATIIKEQEKQKQQEQKRLIIQQRLEETKRRQQQRLQQDKKSNQLLREISPNVVAQDNSISELDRRKKELAEKRQLYNPEVNQNSNYKIQKSSFTYKILEEQRLKKEKEIQQEKEKHELFERRQRYSKLVQDVFAPKLNKNQIQDMLEEVQSGAQTSTMRQLRSSSNASSNKLKMQPQQLKKRESSVKNKTSNVFKAEEAVEGEIDNNTVNIYQQKLKKIMSMPAQKSQFRIRKQKEFKNLYEELPQLPPKKIDYLKEIRSKRETSIEKFGKKNKQNWEVIAEDEQLNSNEKMSQIIQQTSLLENQAKMKEQKAQNDPTMRGEVDDLYINSIKAKLAILDTFKK